jgi:IS30 family transposase
MPYQSTDQLTVQLFFASWEKTGNVAESARQLGLSRFTCYSWIRRRDLPRKQRAGHPGKQRYLQLRAQGVPRRQAAAEVGIGLNTASVWDRGIRHVQIEGRRLRVAGGPTDQVAVRYHPAPAPVPDIHPRYLSLLEREQIADLRRAGYSIRQIAGELARAASTISRRSGSTATSTAGICRMPHTGRQPVAVRGPKPPSW